MRWSIFLFWMQFLVLLAMADNAQALDSVLVDRLGIADSSAKIEAIGELVKTGDDATLGLLQALDKGELYLTTTGKVVIVSDKAVLDATTLKETGLASQDLEKVSINNRIRRQLFSAIATLKLLSPNRETRLQAATDLQNQNDEDFLLLIDQALAKEQDQEIKSILSLTQAGFNLKNKDAEIRLAAVETLANSDRESIKVTLLKLLEKKDNGEFVEPDGRVREAIGNTIDKINRKLAMGEYLGRFFTGLSLASILVLTALGLAITYGLLGVINMAHGEMLMVGAYATYLIQQLFHSYFPGLFDWYLLFAVPVSFVSAGLVGMFVEVTVIRLLYGRPLETLLATWGVSLILIQSVRAIFGAQNVEVANPSWMSGGVIATSNLVMPYNRIIIIVFALVVLAMVWFLLNHTNLGLFIRAVTQNRNMAGCVGVHTGKIDLIGFGLGSGVAGLGGCALSQIGNVGPDLGQSYIIDSFMVVVLGGVGQIMGTVYAALGLGVVNKFMEPHIGAVLTKIMILVFIIIFIQKRPQGLFALKGRVMES